MTTNSPLKISKVSADELADHLTELGAVLRACVNDGASIGFVQPFSKDDSEAFFSGSVLPALRNGKRVLLVAYKDGRLVGSGQLDFDMPPNQPHRAEVRKLLVHPDFRRQGIAKALMAELEQLAAQLGRCLITLDTRTGDRAEPLYASLGYSTAGIIPGYCLDPLEDRLDSTTVMYKAL